MKKIICLFLIFLSCFCVFGCKNNEIETKLIDVEDIVINKSHAYCNKGDKIVLLAQVYPFNANNQNILWKSDNQNIAIVSDGVVEGLNEGRTVISAISEDGNFCDSCVLFVSSPKLDYDKYQNNLTAKMQGYKQNFEQKIKKQNSVFDDKNQKFFQSFVEDLCDKFEYLEKEFYTIKNNIISQISNKSDENVAKNIEILQKNEEFGEILQNSESEDENQISENEKQNLNHGYFFEYKFNSNGIDDEADEFTNFINDKEILREFSW